MRSIDYTIPKTIEPLSPRGHEEKTNFVAAIYSFVAS